jgi:hypothetical protein
VLFGILENQYGIKPQVIECDNEITTQKPAVRRFIESLSIKVEPSPPYTQELNGGAERSGGVVKDKSRSMRAGSKLPSALWKEIVRTAVYLLNRTPRWQYYWKTPYDRFHTYVAHKDGVAVEHRKPNQAHLRVYGCKAYAMTTDALKKANRLQRFNPRAWIGYLVGYNSTNVYRIWNPITNKVIITRDVIFNEQETFNGNLESLKDDMLHIKLNELSELLHKCAIPKESEEEQVQPAEEESEEVRDLAEDELYVETNTEQGGKGLDTEIRVEPYPTPLPTPPAALLAASIRQSPSEELPKEELPKAETAKVQKADSWKAVFCAGTRTGVAGKVENRVFTKAQLERMLKKPKAIHRRNLPSPPDRHTDLIEHPLGYLFEQAEIEHLKSHDLMKSWTEINSRDPRMKGHKILDCRWVYIYKFDKHGRFLKVKARLVVRGDQQAKSLTESTYAATLAGRSFRTLMAIAARFDLELLQYDAVNAFVNVRLEEDVFMKMPPGHRRNGTILKLNKALYGLRRSPLLWQRELTQALRKLGLEPVPHEPCCFIKGGIIIFFYVDDIVIAFRKHQEAEARSLIEKLQSKYRLTGGDNLQWFLGIEVLRDRKKGFVWLSQSAYVDKIANLAESMQPSKTPMERKEFWPYEGVAENESLFMYQKKIGSLLYAAVITRPDIAFAVSRLARFTTNPGPEHHEGADRIPLYLKRTRSLALQFGADDHFRVASDTQSFADRLVVSNPTV